MKTGETIFVYSTEHAFIRNSRCPSIAVSCYVNGYAGDGAVGFGCSRKAVKTRRELVNGCYEFYGKEFRLIKKGEAVYFEPHILELDESGAANSATATATAFTQSEGHLSSNPAPPPISEEFVEKIREMFLKRRSMHRDPNYASELGLLHVDYQLEMQYWPFLTPYESVLYLYGRNQEKIISDLKAYIGGKGLTLRQIDERHFPIY